MRGDVDKAKVTPRRQEFGHFYDLYGDIGQLNTLADLGRSRPIEDRAGMCPAWDDDAELADQDAASLTGGSGAGAAS